MNTSSTIPGYEFLQKIEESATATLWRARQESLDREVVIKLLNPAFARQAQQVEAFLREARAVAKLKSGNIIQVYDIGQHENTLFIVMECVDGYPLTTLLDLGDPIDQKCALSIALAVAQGLSDAWNAERIIHGNLNPDNIMIAHDGEVKIASLGLSAIAGNEPGVIVEAPNYMSPEQARAQGSIDFTSDMYSLGALIYHMVTGQIPFGNLDDKATRAAQIKGQIAFPQNLNPDITPSCAQVIARLMMKDPQNRYANWEGAINDIARLVAGKMIITRPLAGPESTIAAKEQFPNDMAKTVADKMIVNKPAGRGSKIIVKGRSPASRTAEHLKARSDYLKNQYARPTAPLWIKLPLTAALLALLGWLGFVLLWQPYREAYSSFAVRFPDSTASYKSR